RPFLAEIPEEGGEVGRLVPELAALGAALIDRAGPAVGAELHRAEVTLQIAAILAAARVMHADPGVGLADHRQVGAVGAEREPVVLQETWKAEAGFARGGFPNREGGPVCGEEQLIPVGSEPDPSCRAVTAGKQVRAGGFLFAQRQAALGDQ